MAQQRRQEGVVVVTFRLTFDGRLMDAPLVTRSSGSKQLDNAALLAVRRGAPYPSFPLNPKDMKALEIPVKFFLR
jgi:protein TonB